MWRIYEGLRCGGIEQEEEEEQEEEGQKQED